MSHFAKMLFGWCCYLIWIPLPERLAYSKSGMWLLSWCGYYAFSPVGWFGKSR